jgi:hypothetical protein
MNKRSKYVRNTSYFIDGILYLAMAIDDFTYEVDDRVRTRRKKRNNN